jgi:hypothetical protein
LVDPSSKESKDDDEAPAFARRREQEEGSRSLSTFGRISQHRTHDQRSEQWRALGGLSAKGHFYEVVEAFQYPVGAFFFRMEPQNPDFGVLCGR